ncbi:uncharacterized protein MONOS_5750 [Monocercomonoides exilis]|uniref:uncharacterized protein n=1 Tax=Monocercomonoides exilis TaxID=2049356 RepID=UPI003559F2F2|nr:hypothetical protein MONOS_5750 [Monocercomonoides exilis]|eukprot:MONOS_5750.1-p1 / transcript=MONOS_5750.1 / gene=MONOS_5750 / organism=Monocercomonoides_exilis_PA203 / gene_product=unspecified product / transcript_product=unspecified product / location=Mono_scaffold00172:18633-18989(+) / protein_length=86 / sequence_SO=supercontig / SO=protein_coding / is_pseudo=false
MTLRYCLILAHFGDKSKYAFSESAIDEISRAFPDLTVFTAGNDTSELVFPVSALIRSSCYSSSCFNRTLDVEGDQFWFCSASYDC